MVAFTEYYLCFEGKRTKKLWMHLKRKKKINMAAATKTYSLQSNINFEVANIYLHCVLLLQFTEHCILFHTYYTLLQSHVLLQIQIQNYVRILQ